MTARYIAAIDQGTTSSRCIIFDASGALVASAQKEHRQIFPRPGWVKHDAEEIWRNVEQVVAGALTKAGAGPADLAGVGIGAWTGPRYRFTGQLIIPEAHAYLFKARAYVDQQGRFLQIDPIGQNGRLNTLFVCCERSCEPDRSKWGSLAILLDVRGGRRAPTRSKQRQRADRKLHQELGR